MKETLTPSSKTGTSFTPTMNTDIKIKGDFVGLVWLESQLDGETSWERVPDTLTPKPTQFALTVNSTDVVYRFNSELESGSVVTYASGV